MHATGKSPRGLRGDSSAELVLDFMQKDLAAAKAQQYNLQADVAALSENNRRTQQEAERQKSLVYEQMYALQAELDICKQVPFPPPFCPVTFPSSPPRKEAHL